MMQQSDTQHYERRSTCGDKSNVTYNWGPQRSKLAKSGLQSRKLGKPWPKQLTNMWHNVTMINVPVCKICKVLS